MDTLIDAFKVLVAVARTLEPSALLLIVAILFGIRAFTRSVNDGQVEFWHFYSSHSTNLKGEIVNWGDTEKLGILIGIFASTLFMGFVLYFQKVDNWYVVIMFAIWLLFISGSSAFSKWGRAFLDRWLKSKAPVSVPAAPPITVTATASVPQTKQEVG